MIHVIEIIRAIQGKEKELQTALTELIPLARKEAGCLRYDLFQEEDTPQTFMVFMTWEKKENLHIHHNALFIEEFVEKYENILYQSAIETIYQKITS